jgi:hypothetical protein
MSYNVIQQNVIERNRRRLRLLIAPYTLHSMLKIVAAATRRYNYPKQMLETRADQSHTFVHPKGNDQCRICSPN